MPADQRREQVLNVALNIAVGQGLREVTMEAIARESGVTKPVVYAMFANADAVLAALVEREQGRALQQLREAVPADMDLSDPVAAFSVGVSGFLATVRANSKTWKLLLAGDQLPDVARRQHDDVRRLLVRQIAALVEAGLRTRAGGPLDAGLLARLIVVGVEDAAHLALDEPAAFSEKRVVTFLTELARSVMEG